jgi:16S rRNA (guanine527-N7)-methyltransferase
LSELTDQEIRETLLQYVFSPDGNQCNAIRTYISLLLRWNQKISLTTVVDPLEILRFHFGESLFASSAVPIEKGRLADVGSGVGFPGVALAIVIPELAVALIESNSKKAAFLSELARELNLRNVEVIRRRFEQMSVSQPQFDFITARALGNYESLLIWSHGGLAVTGRIVLWLGEDECRRISADSSYSWHDPLRIPGSKRRFILVGSPNF